MARHLDLEEQEQLDELKHFWNQYGNFITLLLIAAFGTVAAWNGWQYWERRQATQASALYEEVERAAAAGVAGRVEQALGAIPLLAADVLAEKAKPEPAREALAWVAAESGDPGYDAVARLRLAGQMAEAKAYDDALKQLGGEFPPQFQPLAADRRGDIYQLQGKKAEAKAEYGKAWQALDERSDYRRLVEVKLNALGVDPQSLKPAAAAGAAKS
jgi:predicted negative regulator of RcsB-dependent stress response